MTREEYIKYRNEGSPAPFYEYYKEKFDEKKHKEFLQANDFFQYMNMWPGVQSAFNLLLAHYDTKWNVIKIQDKQGNLIRYE